MMKAIMITLASLLLSLRVVGSGIFSVDDTVTIELNGSRIVIYTKSKAEFAELEQYDINKMIGELRTQLTDSTTYLEMSSEDSDSYLIDANDADYRRVHKWMHGIVKVTEEGFDTDKTDYRADRRAIKTTTHLNIDIGVNNWLEKGKFPDANNAPYSIRPLGAWYIGISGVNRTWVSSTMFLEWGLGINWYNWKLQDPSYRIIKTDQQTEFVRNQNQNQSGTRSKLKVSYVNVQLVPMLALSKKRKKGIRFGIGGYAGYRLSSYAKYRFREGGDKKKTKERDNFYLKNFRYGLRVQLGWKGLEFFGNYDLNKVFFDNRGPELNALSFGITL